MVKKLTPSQRKIIRREIMTESLRQDFKRPSQRLRRKQIIAIGFARARKKDSSIPTVKEFVEDEGSLPEPEELQDR